MFQRAEKFIRTYFNDAGIYDKYSGENHPAMQIYFEKMYELAVNKDKADLERIMLE
jgi:hypothetical protein